MQKRKPSEPHRIANSESLVERFIHEVWSGKRLWRFFKDKISRQNKIKTHLEFKDYIGNSF